MNARLSRWALYIAVSCLLGIVGVVFGSVIWRYVLNDAPAWSEQVALMLVINVAMFGAAAGVRDEGHIGMESLIGLLPPKACSSGSATSSACITIVFGGISWSGAAGPWRISVWTQSDPDAGHLRSLSLPALRRRRAF